MIEEDNSFYLSAVKRLIIGNIRKDTSLQDLYDCFSSLIKDKNVSFKIAVDKKGKQKGFAAVDVPLTQVLEFLRYNGWYMKGRRITVVMSDGYKIPKSTRWQQDETGVYTSVPNGPYGSSSVPFLYHLFDAGVYLTHPKFAKNIDSVIQRASNCGVEKMVVISGSVHQTEQALSLCRLYSQSLYCTAGVGPKNAVYWTDETENELIKIASSPHCVAIGECGFDLSKEGLISTCAQQLEVFEMQVRLAIKLKKPLVVIAKKAFAETWAMLKKYKDQLDNVAINFVPESIEEIISFAEEGFYIYVYGITWNIHFNLSFRSWFHEDKVSHEVPFDRLLLASTAPLHSIHNSSNIDECIAHYCDDPQEIKHVKKCFDVVETYCKDNYNEPCSLPSMLIMMCLSFGTYYTPQTMSKTLTQNAIQFFQLEESVKEDPIKLEKIVESSSCLRFGLFLSLAAALVAVVAVVCFKYFGVV